MRQTLISTSGAGAALMQPQPARRQSMAARLLESLRAHSAHFFRQINGMKRGGDLLFVDHSPDKGLWLLIGDVAGHGKRAAKHRNGIVETIERKFWSMRSLAHARPSDFLASFESDLKALRVQDDMSLTAIFAHIDLENRLLSFARLGHERIIYFNANTGRVGEIRNKAGGTPIYFGSIMNDEAVDGAVPNVTMHLNPGDVLMFYTDGVFDQKRNGARVSRFALERGVKKAIRENAHLSAPEILEASRQFLAAKSGSRKAITSGDDASIFIVKFE